MNNLIPELSFKEIEKGDTLSINLLKDALSNHGFFSITEHGLSDNLVDDCYKSSKEFFDLDYDIKNTYSSVGSKGARGYTPKGIETAVGEKIADQKEFWHHGPVIDDSFDKKIPKNLIIDQIPNFNENFDTLYSELHKIGSRVLSVIALSLGLENDYFEPWIKKGNSLLLFAGGTGDVLEYLKDNINLFEKITIMDICEPLLKKAEERKQKYNWENVEIVKGDAHNFIKKKGGLATLF